MTTRTTRRIPKFAEKLLNALNSADLPERVTTHVEAGPADPYVYVTHEYAPGRYTSARVMTDAKNPDHLSPVHIIREARHRAEQQSRDPRFTNEAREASRTFNALLAGWLSPLLAESPGHTVLYPRTVPGEHAPVACSCGAVLTGTYTFHAEALRAANEHVAPVAVVTTPAPPVPVVIGV